ncbi:MAG: GntR family transcriptional regulator [Actinomycetota bacterium]
MPSDFSQVTPARSLQEQVAQLVRNNIAAGVLRDGQTLPSTRELAEQWNVSVFTITEAMKLLAREGLVVNKPRSGRVVNAPEQVVQQRVRPGRPVLLLLGGYAGSGKSELGRILARETGWPILDKDTLTRPIVELALQAIGRPPHDRESSEYVTQVRPREYEALSAAAEENVQCGLSVIVTAPFVHEFAEVAWIERVRATYAGLGAAVHLVWVHCEPPTMLTYLRHRGAARDTAKLADWDTYLGAIDPHFRPVDAHHVVDNSASSEPLQAQGKRLVREVLATSE